MDFKSGGGMIRQLRIERKMTQEQLADAIGITSNTVSRIERGLLIPALPTFIGICNALEVSSSLVLSKYVDVDRPMRWTQLSEQLKALPTEKQDKIDSILQCLIETI